MNCKRGDLAMYVGKKARYGAITRVIRRKDWFDEMAWEVDPPIPDGPSSHNPKWVADIALRPIRDSDGTDEMLRIAGKPTETPAQIIQEVADAARV